MPGDDNTADGQAASLEPGIAPAAARLAVCRTCSRHEVANRQDFCGSPYIDGRFVPAECGCWLAFLSRDPLATCPRNKWPAVVDVQDAAQPEPRTIGWAVRGAIGVGRALLTPYDRARVRLRLAVCRRCEHYDHGRDRCPLCGCSISLKARVAAYDCPLGKWRPAHVTRRLVALGALGWRTMRRPAPFG